MTLITPTYAALLTILFIGLSVRTIKQRFRHHVSIGDGGKPELARAIRAHANFAEYVPLALLLIWMTETLAYPSWVIHLLGATLLVGRFSHAYGIMQVKADLRFRKFGMLMTFLVLLSAAVLLLVSPALPVAG